MMCEQVRCPGETAHRDAIFFVSSPSAPLDISSQITVVDSSNSAAMFKMVEAVDTLVQINWRHNVGHE